jgi:hypothetical protein
VPAPVNAAFQYQLPKSASISSKLTHWLIILYLIFGPLILTQDIPVHLNSAYILSDLLFSPHSFFHAWFELNQGVFSNILLQWAAMIPAAWISPNSLYRLTLLVMILLITGGFKKVLKELEVEQNAFFILPFIFPVLFLKGFANFYLGIGLMFYVWAEILYAIREKPRNRLILLSLLTLAAHPFTFACMMGMSILILIGIKGEKWKATAKQRLHIFAMLLPAVLLFITNKNEAYPLSMQGWPAHFLWELIYTGHDWIWYASNEKYFVLIPAIIMIAITVYANILKYNIYALTAAAITAALVTLYFFAPVGVEENLYIYPRVLFVAFLMLAFTAALSHIPEKFQSTIKYICLISPVALILQRYEAQESIEKQYFEIQSLCSDLPKGSVILPIQQKAEGDHAQQASIFLHVLHLATMNKKILSLDYYAAHTQYFPIKWKAEKNPYLLLPEGWETQPEIIDRHAIQKVNPDYIIEIFPLAANPALGTPEKQNASGIRYPYPPLHNTSVNP